MTISNKYKYLDLSKDDCKNKYNNNPFVFNHSLCDNNILSIESLADISLQLPSSQVFFSSGNVDVTANLDTAHKIHKPNMSLEAAFENIESAGAFVMVRQPETSPVLKELFGDLINDVTQFTKEIDPETSGFMLYLFIASPGSVTPFHIDRYSTFLFQLQGHKDVNVWAPWDRELITDREMEKFFSHTEGFSPELKDGYLEKAIVNHIHPGQGVHIPFVAPHWIQNSDEVSVSLSIIFNSQQTISIANALKFNNWYRKIINKSAGRVNEHKMKDKAKSLVFENYQRFSGWIRK